MDGGLESQAFLQPLDPVIKLPTVLTPEKRRLRWQQPCLQLRARVQNHVHERRRCLQTPPQHRHFMITRRSLPSHFEDVCSRLVLDLSLLPTVCLDSQYIRPRGHDCPRVQVIRYSMSVGIKFLQFDTVEIARTLPQVTPPSTLVPQWRIPCLKRDPWTGLDVREIVRFQELLVRLP